MVKQIREHQREGQMKLLMLREAVKRYVKPGMKLHLAGGIGGPSAAICEIIRQYRHQTPQFTLIQSTLAAHSINLIYCQLVRKLIFSACPPDATGSMRPSKLIQQAFEEKKMEMENWSLCSLQQRLMAGALGVPFMPTRSILGSQMALDNAESFQEIDDPFKSGAKAGVLKALNPDISIVHGCIADVHGNTILAAPVGDDLWGSLASSYGVLVTVEKIVDTGVIRKYSALVKIPGLMVNAVSEAPLGVHPFSLFGSYIGEFKAYGQDTEFLMELHRAYKDDKLDDWLQKWVIDCPIHEDYLNKIGSQRIKALREMATKEAVYDEVPPAISPLESLPIHGAGKTPSPHIASKSTIDSETMMPVALAREIVRSVLKFGHKTILIGGGSRTLGGWMAYYLLMNEGYDVELIIGNGQIGCTPQRGEGIMASMALTRSAAMLTDVITVHGVIVGGKNNKCLAVLGAGQIDPYGNINSTKGFDGRFLVGSGGANDSVNAQEVIVVIDQSRNRFAENLPYITCPGNQVSTVISTMGIFRKTGPKEKLSLVACFPNPDLPTLEERIKHIQDHCGWSLKITDPVEEISEPNDYELKLKNWFLSPVSSRIEK
jgi:acyl CoA:acetate/3-ketoacid CoA transferase alpha subunit/acyl CoA:acetate/3-ketoacid CoA transferase beta subunit